MLRLAPAILHILQSYNLNTHLSNASIEHDPHHPVDVVKALSEVRVEGHPGGVLDRYYLLGLSDILPRRMIQLIARWS